MVSHRRPVELLHHVGLRRVAVAVRLLGGRLLLVDESGFDVVDLKRVTEVLRSIESKVLAACLSSKNMLG